jgi:4-amino-4-deoxy-L-arabinose transferase-like glycosyltransferase
LPERKGRKNVAMKKIFHNIIVIILACITFAWLFYSSKNYSRTSDEKIYTICAHSFIEWTKSTNPFSKYAIFRYWDISYEHPSFVKILSGITWAVFHDKLGDLISYRLATIINFSFLIVLLYFLTSPYFGRTTAVCAGVFLLCIPEVVEYAHFAEININLSLLWFLATIFFLKGLKNKRWIYISGVIFGLALGSKITAIVIPAAILIWIIKYRPVKSGSVYVIFLLSGILIFILSWPSLWFNFPSGLIEHIKFHISSIPVNPSKLWYSGIKSFFFSIPPGLTILFIIGVAGTIIEKNEYGMLLFINMLLMFLISSIPFIYPGEGIRYFLPVIPFAVIFCALGLKYLITPVIKRNIVYV